MNKDLLRFCFVAVIVAGLAGCSKPAPKQAARPHDKIQGKVQIGLSANAADTALNAGGQTVYMWHGPHRYTLFFKQPVQMEKGKHYIAEGIDAQKAIDEIGDPDQGKNGYPLQSSCDRVVSMAWPGQAFDVHDAQASALRARIKRYPARGVFLVEKVTLDTDQPVAKKNVADEEEDKPSVTVDAEKQKAALIQAAPVKTAPLWQPEGGTARCKLIVDEEGKVASLETGNQLCEAVDWEQYKYQPHLEKGKPVRVMTEVDIKFDPRK